MRAPYLALVLAALLATAGARGAIVLSSTSEVSVGVTAPPVIFELGASGSSTRYFSPLTLSANGTAASGTLLARAGGDLYAKDALRVVNAHALPQSVTLSATPIPSAAIDLFVLHLYDGATLVRTLDLEAPGPTTSFVLPAGAKYRLDVRVDVADGAGNHTVPAVVELSLRVASGSIDIAHPRSAPALRVHTVEVPLRPLIGGSTVGANSTNGTASVNAPTVLANTQYVWYLNNTNAAAASYVKLVLASSGSISDVSTANIGVAGSTSVDHVKVSGGAVSRSAGASFQALAPGSANRIYVTSLEGVLFNGATFDLDILVSDGAAGESYVVTKARLTLT